MTAATVPADPTIRDVLAAQRAIEHDAVRTPTLRYAPLDDATGAAVVVKHENLQHTGAFKVRGALHLLGTLEQAELARGIVGASTGNLAQALAFAAARRAVGCTIVMPLHPNPVKERAVRALGADVVLAGDTFDEAGAHAERLAAERGARLVLAGDEPALVTGVATVTLELLQQAPDLDVLLVPVGSGTGAAGAGLVAAALAPHVEVVGVQSSASPAAYDSWRTGQLVARPSGTWAEGLAVGHGFALTQRLLGAHLHDFVLVDDDAIRAAQRLYLTAARTVAEGAGAAALAAVLADPGRFAGRTVGVVCSGGNASEAELCAALGA